MSFRTRFPIGSRGEHYFSAIAGVSMLAVCAWLTCPTWAGGGDDCNGNGVPDAIDIVKGTSQDCNGNAIPDECDIDDGTSQDCNTNTIPDECDIDDGTSNDCDTNGIPDECVAPPLSTCPADVSPQPCGDDIVNQDDLLGVIAVFGPCTGDPCVEDFAPPDGDTRVSKEELFLVTVDWGECIAPTPGAANGPCETEILAPDADPGDWYGRAVAIDGNQAVIGSIAEDEGGFQAGAAYVVRRNDSGAWVHVAKLIADSSADLQQFGRAVAISGNRVIVLRSNLALVYERDTGGADNWGLSGFLMPSTGPILDYDVDVDRDTAVVGANGAAFVFEFDGALWQEVAMLTYPNAIDDFFGRTVAIHGDTIIVGAPGGDEVFQNTTGSVRIYDRNNGGPNNWGLSRVVSNLPNTDAQDRLGFSVDIHRNMAVVGAPQFLASPTQSGYVLVLQRDRGGADNWGPVTRLEPETESDIAFGTSVGIDGDNILIGAMLDDDAGSNAGAAYLFRRFGDSVEPIRKYVASDGTPHDLFGRSIAVSQATAFVGAHRTDDNEFDSGSAYAYFYGCAADVAPPGGNGQVNVDDLLAVINAWGKCSGCPADINDSGFVNVDDLLAVINAWGACLCPEE